MRCDRDRYVQHRRGGGLTREKNGAGEQDGFGDRIRKERSGIGKISERSRKKVIAYDKEQPKSRSKEAQPGELAHEERRRSACSKNFFDASDF